MSFGYTMLGFGATQSDAVYDPQSMTFDGSTGYYNKTSISTSGNLVTGVVSFNRSTFTGGSVEAQMRVGGASGYSRLFMYLVSSDHATTAIRNKLVVQTNDSVNTVVCKVVSIDDLNDGSDHTAFYAFNGDTGAVTFYVDGVDADDTGNAERVAPTTGTLAAGASSSIGVGASYSGGFYWSNTLRYAGYHDVYLTNPTDFHHPTNGLQELDTSGWTEWGSQPLLFAEDGKCDTNNDGSLGALTKNGTITGPA